MIGSIDPHPIRRGLVSAAFIWMSVVAPLPAAAEDELRIDVPVVLEDAKVVMNLDHAAFTGDEPVGLNFMNLMLERFREHGTKASLIAVFHGENGYMLLDDSAYRRVRHNADGNPYKAQINALMHAGVSFEECAQTMRVNQWHNDDLLPGAKVNSGAILRIIELVQQGYVQIQP